MKIIFTGGGTGGHIFPLLAIARELRRLSPEDKLELVYFGPKPAGEALSLLKTEGCGIKRVVSGKLRRYFSLNNFFDVLKIPVGIVQSFLYLFFAAPDLVFSKGGFGSFPVAFSAKILGIPFFLHESDIVPGLASRLESKWALEIFISFPKTEYFPKEKVVLVGNPVRQEILKSNIPAKKAFNLAGDKPLILLMGGSQGCQKINDLVLEILPELLADFEIIHQTGEKNFNRVKREAEAIVPKALLSYYHPTGFLEEKDLGVALNNSDFVVSRAGGGSIFEIAAVAKPAILIPLANSAQNHQLKNGYAFSKAGAAEVIEEANLKPHFFLARLRYFLSRDDILEEMAKNSKNFGRVKAAKIIASYLLEYLK